MSSLGFLYASYIPDWVERRLKMPMSAELHLHLKPDLSSQRSRKRQPSQDRNVQTMTALQQQMSEEKILIPSSKGQVGSLNCNTSLVVQGTPSYLPEIICHFLLQRSNPCIQHLLHQQAVLYHCAIWEAQNKMKTTFNKMELALLKTGKKNKV